VRRSPELTRPEFRQLRIYAIRTWESYRTTLLRGTLPRSISLVYRLALSTASHVEFRRHPESMGMAPTVRVPPHVRRWNYRRNTHAPHEAR